VDHLSKKSEMEALLFITRMRGGGFRAECHLILPDGRPCGWWSDSSRLEYAEVAMEDHEINIHGRSKRKRREHGNQGDGPEGDRRRGGRQDR
jgi:hypothetical protein